MKFRVIEKFEDMKDENHLYEVGDEFPHDGRRVSKKRLEELSSEENRRGIPLIEGYEEE